MNAVHQIVNLKDDAYIPPPGEMAADLARLAVDAQSDYYGQGGAVAEFEAQIAAHLGKEAAAVFPTGTLGNLVVLLRLTGGPPARVITHRHGHLFNDAGDNLAQLGGLTMVALEGEGAGFTGNQLRAEIARADSARVASRIAAVTVESPSRRLDGRLFGPDLDDVINVAKAANIPLFLDGARMFIACGWTGITPADMAAPFDLVYVSLYKYLKAPFGCVIAGPKSLLDGIHHDRRRFGGGLWRMWPAAVPASDALPRQHTLWQQARAVGDAVLDKLREFGLDVLVYPDGTNVFRIGLPEGTDALDAGANDLAFPELAQGATSIALKINETWIGQDPDDLARRIDRAFGGQGM